MGGIEMIAEQREPKGGANIAQNGVDSGGIGGEGESGCMMA
jgi:hypothetical protein